MIPLARGTLALVAVLPFLAACTSSGGPSEAASPIAVQPDQTAGGSAQVESVEFVEPMCGNGFRTIDLDHTVNLRRPDDSFEANGAGVALGDLDNDDRIDIVLGNLDGPLQVLWNQGDFEFLYQEIGSGRARSIQLIDHDVDGDLDIVVGTGLTPPLIYDNDLNSANLESATSENSGVAFNVVSLPGVTAPAYSMQWFDPDRDGDLDAVLAAYDMEFGRRVAGEYVNDREFGVWFVEHTDSGWQQTQMATVAHALAATTVDMNNDGFEDIVIGNDYEVPDGVWLWSDAGWIEDPDALQTTAANTMSFDVGDVNNDGQDELYATDMVAFDETSNEEFWSRMAGAEHDPPGPQLVENVLIDLADGDNLAPALGVDATGWSWSGRLLDLDNDRDLDLYVANGMLPTAMYTAFPGGELQEPNLAFRNNTFADDAVGADGEQDGAAGRDRDDGDVLFSRSDDWSLGSLASTRGLAAADLDNDGDLDLVSSTVDSPAQVFVNELCGGQSIVIEPRSIENGNVFGARVTVASGGVTQTRTIRSGIGYLSADPPLAHVGLGQHPVDWITIDWPDGERTLIEGPDAAHLTVTRYPGG